MILKNFFLVKSNSAIKALFDGISRFDAVIDSIKITKIGKDNLIKIEFICGEVIFYEIITI